MASPLSAQPSSLLTAARSHQGHHPLSPQEKTKYPHQDIPLTHLTASCFLKLLLSFHLLAETLTKQCLRFLPKLRFSQAALAFVLLVEQEKKKKKSSLVSHICTLECKKPRFCLEEAAENIGKSQSTEVAYWEKSLPHSAGSCGHPIRGRVPDYVCGRLFPEK